MINNFKKCVLLVFGTKWLCPTDRWHWFITDPWWEQQSKWNWKWNETSKSLNVSNLMNSVLQLVFCYKELYYHIMDYSVRRFATQTANLPCSVTVCLPPYPGWRIFLTSLVKWRGLVQIVTFKKKRSYLCLTYILCYFPRKIKRKSK